MLAWLTVESEYYYNLTSHMINSCLMHTPWSSEAWLTHMLFHTWLVIPQKSTDGELGVINQQVQSVLVLDPAVFSAWSGSVDPVTVFECIDVQLVSHSRRVARPRRSGCATQRVCHRDHLSFLRVLFFSFPGSFRCLLFIPSRQATGPFRKEKFGSDSSPPPDCRGLERSHGCQAFFEWIIKRLIWAVVQGFFEPRPDHKRKAEQADVSLAFVDR